MLIYLWLLTQTEHSELPLQLSSELLNFLLQSSLPTLLSRPFHLPPITRTANQLLIDWNLHCQNISFTHVSIDYSHSWIFKGNQKQFELQKDEDSELEQKLDQEFKLGQEGVGIRLEKVGMKVQMNCQIENAFFQTKGITGLFRQPLNRSNTYHTRLINNRTG